MDHERVRIQVRVLQDDCQNKSADVQTRQEEFNEKKREIDEIKHRTKQIKRRIYESIEKTPANADEEKRLFEEQEKLFEKEKIPDNEDEVHDEIAREEGRLNVGVQDGSADDVHQYEQMQNEEAALQRRMEKAEQNRENWQTELNQRLDAWVQPLQQFIHSINENYRKFFEQLGCVGEVSLSQPEDKVSRKRNSE
jgi:chromosome segregation ATPase